MNERILKFADQILPNEKEFHKGDPKDWGYFFSGEELEQFVELIVKECAEVSVLGDPKYSAQYNILNHFGVK